MNIARRICEATDKYCRNDIDCLTDMSIAVAATASKRRAAAKDGEAFKDFVHEEMRLITMVAFQRGMCILNLEVQYSHPELIPNANGCVTLQQILYHVLRCGLIHEATLPSDLEFRRGGVIAAGEDGSNRLILPMGLLMGCILAVVTAPENAGETYPQRLRLGGVPFNELAGNPARLLALVGAPVA